MKNQKRSLATVIALAATAISAVALQDTAEARSTGAAMGRAVATADIGCFSIWSGGLFNNCSTYRSVEVALPVDSSGTKTIQMTHTTGAWDCYAYAVNKNNTSQWNATSETDVALGGGWTESTHSGITLPSMGILVAGCWIAPSKVLHMINW